MLMDELGLPSIWLCWTFDQLAMESEYPVFLAPDEVQLFDHGPDVAAKAEKGNPHKRKARFCPVHKCCREFLDRIGPCASYRMYMICSLRLSAPNP